MKYGFCSSVHLANFNKHGLVERKFKIGLLRLQICYVYKFVLQLGLIIEINKNRKKNSSNNQRDYLDTSYLVTTYHLPFRFEAYA